jgi:hypothetical protein
MTTTRTHHRPPRTPPAGRVVQGSTGVLFGETETPRFIDAVRKVKEEQRKNERKTREAKQKVKLAQRKTAER